MYVVIREVTFYYSKKVVAGAGESSCFNILRVTALHQSGVHFYLHLQSGNA